ncbi:sushi, von Willebrand factor type A, EGF and pentraxin domain-containing protein 1-like, partial [Mya arenaria]|uniref:sushi, von Willebrand factor type A, EGF and pentraxin domain-containing protein 1-like n=1 Tax=Mya arenaria TaxID=6604 RepID=UPI0022DEED49
MTSIGNICLLIFYHSGIQLIYSATTTSNTGFSETTSYPSSSVPSSTTEHVTVAQTSRLPNTTTQYNFTTTSSTLITTESLSTELRTNAPAPTTMVPTTTTLLETTESLTNVPTTSAPTLETSTAPHTTIPIETTVTLGVASDTSTSFPTTTTTLETSTAPHTTIPIETTVTMGETSDTSTSFPTTTTTLETSTEPHTTIPIETTVTIGETSDTSTSFPTTTTTLETSTAPHTTIPIETTVTMGVTSDTSTLFPTTTTTLETSTEPYTIISIETTVTMGETSDASTSFPASYSTTTQWSQNCGPINTISNGQIDLNDPSNMTYGASANVTCESGFDASIDQVTCLSNGSWSEASCLPKDCGSVETISNGQIDLNDPSNTTYGAAANVTCESGFDASIDQVTCLSNGSWSEALCSPKDCGPVESIPNGQTDLNDQSNTTYGAAANVTCNSGYDASLDQVICLSNGSWSEASCTPKDCRSVETISNGQIDLNDPSNTTYGAAANVTCESGFDASIDQVTCLSNGSWSKASCSPKDCGSVETISNGQIDLNDPSNTTYGAAANFTCESGFDASIDQVTCLSNGSWSEASCSPKDCGSVETISNGQIDLNDTSNTTYGAAANVTCESGFDASIDQMTCLSNGSWSEASCSPKDCGPFETIPNGQTDLNDPSNTTYGAAANVTCYSGYDASIDQVICLSNGSWLEASCTPKDCGPVETIPNGQTDLNDPSNTTYGAAANVTCNSGYDASIDQVICLSNGSWSEASCIPKDCGPVESLPNGRIDLNDPSNMTYGASANVTCESGFDASIDQVICLSNGSWSEASCLPKDCGSVETISNGQIDLNDPSNTTYGAAANVTCESGFDASIDQVTCISNGSWSEALCSPKDCGPVESIPNGQTDLNDPSNTTYGAAANVTCNSGYDASIDQVICLSNGSWSEASCIPKDCGPVESLPNGRIDLNDPSNMTYGASANVTCESGFDASIDQVICLSNGSWSEASCLPKDCGSVETISNGQIDLNDPSNTTYGAAANVTCESGFDASIDQVTCISNGSWSEALCSPKDCGPVESIPNGQTDLNDPSNTTYGAAANVTCNSGYDASIDQVICLSNGSWSEASCIPKDCGPVESLPNGRIDLNDPSNMTYGASTNVTCESGFDASIDQVTCLSNGSWSEASCLPKDCGSVETISNGQIDLNDPSNTTYGAAANVTCESGFDASIDQVTCISNGSWSEALCSPKDCGPVESIPNGQTDLNDPSSTTYGAAANVTCNSGYDASIDQVICLSNGSWSEASCIPKDCGPVESLPKGRIDRNDPSNMTYGASANVTCESGFDASIDQVTCLSNGSWSEAFCLPKDCGSVETISNGQIDLNDPSNMTYGASANVTCESGFDASIDQVTCLSNGSWSEASCLPKDCGSVETISNGQIDLNDPSNTTYGAAANVTCESGFDASIDQVTCISNGSWSEALCSPKDCGPVESIPNGQTDLNDPSNTTYGAAANVTCNSGYDASIDQVICLSNGSWSEASCIPKDCGPVESLPNGRIDLNDPSNMTYGASANVTCESGFDASIDQVTCLSNGSWSEAFCLPKDCGSVETISNGQIDLNDPSNTTYGAAANVTCESGFDASIDQVTCISNGSWSEALCSPKDCGSVETISNGQIDLNDPSNMTYGASANVTCESGFDASIDQVTCLSNGSWSEASCLPKDCGSVETISNGQIDLNDPSNTTYGAAANVTCESGFDASIDQVTCISNGSWSEALCSPKDCGPVESIPNGQTDLNDPSNTTYGAAANVTCNSGYDASIDQVICLSNGSWSEASCIPKDCGPVESLPNGRIDLNDPSNMTYGASANVTCESGFDASIDQVTCLSNGSWSEAFCLPKDCGSVETISNGQIDLNDPSNTTYGAAANVTCESGFDASIDQVTCISNGSWSEALCSPKDCGSVETISNGQIDLNDPSN